VSRLPANETQRPHPLHPFGAALYAAMRYVEARMGRDWCGLVLSSTFGPRMSLEHTELGRALFDMLRRRTPSLAVDATSAYDWLYVEDAVDAIVRSLSRGLGLMCVGTAETVPMGTLVDEVAAEVGYLGEASYIPAGASRPAQLALDASLIETRLGWRPWTSRTEGIKQTVNWATDQTA
jgi:nucleoside-diphosphate-sugar epimerase